MSTLIRLKKIVPTVITKKIKSWLESEIRKYKAPRMVWGYKDSTGEWRKRTRISDTVFFYHPERITIADNVFVWHYSIIDGTGGLKIGEGSQIGAWVGIFTHSSHIAHGINLIKRIFLPKFATAGINNSGKPYG